MRLRARPVRRMAASGALVLAGWACGGGDLTLPPSDGDWPGFRDAAAYATGGTTLTSLDAADVTGDGHLDLIVVARGGEVRVLPGAGTGVFAAATALTAGADPRTARAGDVDGDGVLDLVVLGYFDNAFFVRRGLGGGQFAAPTAYPLRNHGQQLAIADVNDDGFDDVVAAHDGSGQPVYVTVFLGSAGGVLEKRWEHATPYAVSTDLAVGDIDGDGRTDFAVGVGDNRTSLLVFRGLGTGAFADPLALDPLPTQTPGAADGTDGVDVADVDGDGRDDIVAAHHTLNEALSVRLSTGAGFAAPQVLAAPSPVRVAVGDVTGDGRPDVVLSHLEAGSISVTPRTSAGSFGAPRSFPAGPAPVSLVLADFDGDGTLDVAATDIGDHRVRVFLNRN